MEELQNEVLTQLRRIIRATDLYSRELGKVSGLTAPQLVVWSCDWCIGVDDRDRAEPGGTRQSGHGYEHPQSVAGKRLCRTTERRSGQTAGEPCGAYGRLDD